MNNGICLKLQQAVLGYTTYSIRGVLYVIVFPFYFVFTGYTVCDPAFIRESLVTPEVPTSFI